MKTRTRSTEGKRAQDEERASNADVIPGVSQVPASQGIATSRDRPVVPSMPALQDTGDFKRAEEIELQNVNSEAGHAEAGLYGVEEIPCDQAANPKFKRFLVSHPDLPSLAEETSSSSHRVDSGDNSLAKEVYSL